MSAEADPAPNVDPDPAPSPDPAPTPDPAPDPAPSPDPDPAPSNVLWPENWRTEMSGGDEKVAEELNRYAEPGLIGPALIEAKKKISAGLSPEPLAENATDEQVAEYRKKNGIPAEPGGYFENLPEGIVVGDEDKAGMEKLATAMHAAHQPPAAVHAAMGVYYQHLSDVMAERAETDATDKRDTDDALNELYGNEFRRNINDMGAWLGLGGEETKAKILSSRTPEGQRLGNDPGVVKWLISQMRIIDPLVTVPGLGPGEPGAALEDEITKIEERIQNDNAGYRADKKMQARYLELLEARK